MKLLNVAAFVFGISHSFVDKPGSRYIAIWIALSLPTPFDSLETSLDGVDCPLQTEKD